MKKLFVLFALILGYGLVTASDLSNSYVSLNGNFYIQYPADWKQIPFADVDRYLASKKAGRPIYNYDAVFAPKNSDPYYSGSYFIMTVDTVGKLSDKQIDSVLNVLSSNFGKGIKYFPVSNFMADLKTDSPNYDKKTKTVSIYNKIVQDNTSIKNSLIMIKFYDFGIATFYCYALGDAFETDKELFSQIVASLSTEDVKSKLPKEQVKVADIKTTKKSYGDTENKSTLRSIAIFSGIFIVLYLLLRYIRRKRQNS